MRIEGYDFPDDLWYDAREHLWLRPERQAGEWVVTVGIDAAGQDALGEVVYVQLTEAGRVVARGEPLGSLEAEKMVRPLLAPVAGVVHDVNRGLLAAPHLLNRDPYGEGWLVRIRAQNWEAERGQFLHGEAAVREWVRAELQAMNEER